MAMGELSQPLYVTDQKNPAVASKCQRMVLKRANDQWESTHIPSSCSIVNDPEEDAVKVCKEVTKKEIKWGASPDGHLVRIPHSIETATIGKTHSTLNVKKEQKLFFPSTFIFKSLSKKS